MKTTSIPKSSTQHEIELLILDIIAKDYLVIDMAITVKDLHKELFINNLELVKKYCKELENKDV